MKNLKQAINKKANLALLQMETLHENLLNVDVITSAVRGDYIASWGDDPRSKKTALKRQIVELRQNLLLISQLLE